MKRSADFGGRSLSGWGQGWIPGKAIWLGVLGMAMAPAAPGASYFAWTARGVTWHGNANVETPAWPEDGILNESPVVWQLIGSPDAVADPPDLANPAGGYVGGGDVVWAARHFALGDSTNEEGTWEAGLYSAGALRTTLVAGHDHDDGAPWYVYQRIFQARAGEVAAGTWYYESSPVRVTRDACQDMGMPVYIGSAAYRPALMPDRQVVAASATLDVTRAAAVIGAEGVQEGQDGNGVEVRGPARRYLVTGTGHVIRVVGGDIALVLSNAAVDVSGTSEPAMAVSTGAFVRMTLVGANQLRGGEGGPGIRVPVGAALAIEAGGEIEAVGGAGAAGIGGGRMEGGGQVSILGGSVLARGDRASGAMDIGAGGGGLEGGATDSQGISVYEVVMPLAPHVGPRRVEIPLVSGSYRYDGYGCGNEAWLHAWLPPGTYAVADGVGSDWIAEIGVEGAARLLPADPADWNEEDRSELHIRLDETRRLVVSLAAIYTNFAFSLEQAQELAGTGWTGSNGIPCLREGTNVYLQPQSGSGFFRLRFERRVQSPLRSGTHP